MSSVSASDAIDLDSNAHRTTLDLAGRGLAPLMALGHYMYRQTYDPLPTFRHRTLVVLAVAQPSPVLFAVNETTTVLAPGKILCIPPGSTYSPGLDRQPRGEMYWLILKPDPLPHGGALERAVRLLAAKPPEIWNAPKEAIANFDLAFRIAAEDRDWISDGELQHVCSLAVLQIARSCEQNGHRTQNVQHPYVARALTWVEARLNEPLTATDMAAASGLAPSHFYKVFREATGTTPKDYLLRRKTDEARLRLAADPHALVTDVAHALGFSSSQYFATVFRRYQGVSPSNARAVTSTATSR